MTSLQFTQKSITPAALDAVKLLRPKPTGVTQSTNLVTTAAPLAALEAIVPRGPKRAAARSKISFV